MVQTLSMCEIREALAKDEAEACSGYDFETICEIFLNGIPGYNNMDNDDVIDYYVQRFYPKMGLDDEEPVEILHVLDDGNGQVTAVVIQHQNDVQVDWR